MTRGMQVIAGAILAALCGTQAPAGSPEVSVSGGAPPNLVVLIADDLRRDSLGAYGDPLAATPHVDRLAAEGVTFDEAFVTSSICPTSRASILTGQWARRHGIWDFATDLRPEQLAATYPAILRRAGYFVGHVGKWGVGDVPAGLFDFDGTFPGQGIYRVETDGGVRHLTAVLSDRVEAFFDRRPAGRPFVLTIAFKAPHVQDTYDLLTPAFPHDPDFAGLHAETTMPPPTVDPRLFEALPAFLRDSENRLRWAHRFWGPARYQESVKGYYRLIAGIDRAVGRLRERLERDGLAGDTVVVFTSDNGLLLGEWGLAGKWIPFEPSIRVPLIVFDPRRPGAERGVRRREVALNVDLAPTLLELAGEGAGELQGESLVPLISGATVVWREELFYEHLFEHPRIPRSEAIRTREWKYISWLGREERGESLFRLVDDHGETRDLAGEPAQATRLEELRKRLEEWRRRVAAP